MCWDAIVNIIYSIYIHILYTSNLYIYNTLSISNYEIWLGLEGIVFWLFFSFFCFQFDAAFFAILLKGLQIEYIHFCYGIRVLGCGALAFAYSSCVCMYYPQRTSGAIFDLRKKIYIIIYYIAGMSKPCARKQQLVECDGEMFLPVGFPPFFRISVLHSNITG